MAMKRGLVGAAVTRSLPRSSMVKMTEMASKHEAIFAKSKHGRG